MSTSFITAVDDRSRRHSRSVAAGYSVDVLDSAHVAVVGAGALGQNVLLNLALAGVATVTVVDFDVFEDHNVTRSPLFPRPDQLAVTEGSKALGVALRMFEMASNDAIEIRCYTRPVQRVPLTAIANCDVIVSAVDSPTARRWLAGTARLVGVPLVEGGFDGHAFNVTAFSALPDDACLGCLSPDAEPGFSCGERARLLAGTPVVPALQTTAALAGAVVAEHAIAICHGDVALPLNSVYHGDARAFQVRRAGVTRSPACKLGHRRAVAHVLGSVPTSWDALAMVAGPNDEFVLAEPIVLSNECVMCGAWCRPNAPVHEWRSAPFCVACMSGGHPTDGAYPAIDVVSQVSIIDVAERLRDVPVGFEEGGAIVVDAPQDGPRLVVFPGIAAPDGRFSRTQ